MAKRARVGAEKVIPLHNDDLNDFNS